MSKRKKKYNVYFISSFTEERFEKVNIGSKD